MLLSADAAVLCLQQGHVALICPPTHERNSTELERLRMYRIRIPRFQTVNFNGGVTAQWWICTSRPYETLGLAFGDWARHQRHACQGVESRIQHLFGYQPALGVEVEQQHVSRALI